MRSFQTGREISVRIFGLVFVTTLGLLQSCSPPECPCYEPQTSNIPAPVSINDTPSEGFSTELLERHLQESAKYECDEESCPGRVIISEIVGGNTVYQVCCLSSTASNTNWKILDRNGQALTDNPKDCGLQATRDDKETDQVFRAGQQACDDAKKMARKRALEQIAATANGTDCFQPACSRTVVVWSLGTADCEVVAAGDGPGPMPAVRTVGIQPYHVRVFCLTDEETLEPAQ